MGFVKAFVKYILTILLLCLNLNMTISGLFHDDRSSKPMIVVLPDYLLLRPFVKVSSTTLVVIAEVIGCLLTGYKEGWALQNRTLHRPHKGAINSHWLSLTRSALG